MIPLELLLHVPQGVAGADGDHDDERGPADAVRDWVIVPYRIEHHDGPEMSVDDSCVGWIARAAAQYGPGLCNAASIEDAEAFALRLRQEGIAAQAVHSACTEVWVRSRIDQLREGRLQVLVHVAMLSEGVDLPWLRWLCMRRPVGSRVRFCQEVGRVLLASEGKTHAVLYDPHDLLAVMGLSYAAVLEGGAKRLLMWRTPAGWTMRAIDRGVLLNSQKLIGLADLEVPVTSNSASNLVEWLGEFEAENMHRLIAHQAAHRMGWIKQGEVNGFLLPEIFYAMVPAASTSGCTAATRSRSLPAPGRASPARCPCSGSTPARVVRFRPNLPRSARGRRTRRGSPDGAGRSILPVPPSMGG